MSLSLFTDELPFPVVSDENFNILMLMKGRAISTLLMPDDYLHLFTPIRYLDMGSPKHEDKEGAKVVEVEQWQAECAGLSSRLGALRRRTLWTDCSFVAGAAGAELRAHKVLLAAASPVFAAMLYGPLATPHHQIRVEDILPRAFDLLIEYIYTDNIEIESCEIAHSLYYAAQKYMMPHLQTVCRTYILENVTPQSALASYEFSKLFGEDEIRDTCLEVMSESTHEVLESGKVEEAAASTLAALTALEELALSSELELLRALEWHAVAHSGPARRDHTTVLEEGDDEVEPNKQTEQSNGTKSDALALRDAIKNIRFLTVDPKELAEYDLSPLLSESEILAITMNLLSRNARVPLPAGFSTSKEYRLQGKRDQTTFKCKVQITAELFEDTKDEYKSLYRFYIENIELELCGMEDSDCITFSLSKCKNDYNTLEVKAELFAYTDNNVPRGFSSSEFYIESEEHYILENKLSLVDLEEQAPVTVELTVIAITCE